MSHIKTYICSICGLSHEVGDKCPKPEAMEIAASHARKTDMKTKTAQEIKDEIWPAQKGSTAWLDIERVAIIQKTMEWAGGAIVELKPSASPSNIRS